MPVFIGGLLLGGLSGAVTYAGTADGQLAAAVAAVVAVLTWLGFACVIFLDD
jgi:uncharacterized membrane protein